MKNNPYVRGLRTAVFDIETMGLSPQRSPLILGGIYDLQDGRLHQFFAEETQAEEEVLRRTLEQLRCYDAVITYNGDSFDWPFFYRRARRYGLQQDPLLIWSIDLYRWLRRYWTLAERLPNLRQTSVEEALGLAHKRRDKISGRESVELYRRYLAEGGEEDRRLILLHNRDDLLQLAGIFGKLTFLPYHRIAYETGFFLTGLSSSVAVDSLTWSGNSLTASGRSQPGALAASIYGEGYRFDYAPDTGRMDLAFLCEKKDHLTYVDLSTLPFAPESLEGYAGYTDGLLVVREDSQPLHRECCALVKLLIETLWKEEL